MIEREWYVVVSQGWHRVLVQALNAEDAFGRAQRRWMLAGLPRWAAARVCRRASPREAFVHVTGVWALEGVPIPDRWTPATVAPVHGEVSQNEDTATPGSYLPSARDDSGASV